ncbi:hypothetical protein ACWYVZ_07875 [Pediococcus acidilactici]
MKIDEFRKLICNKLWLWQLADREAPWDRGVLFLGGNEYDKIGLTSLIFKENGSISVPTKVGFIPAEGHYWDFDEETQQLLFYDQDRKQVNSATLADHGMYNANEIVFSDGGTILINFPNFDLKEERPFPHNFFFVPRENFKISLQRTLVRKGYDTYQVGEDATLIPYLNAVYECLIKHPEVKNIIVSQNGEIIDDFFVEAGDCLLIANNNGVPGLNYLAGNRDLVLELLIAILSENNKRQLNTEDLRTEEEMIEQIITSRFANRFIIK